MLFPFNKLCILFFLVFLYFDWYRGIHIVLNQVLFRTLAINNSDILQIAGL